MEISKNFGIFYLKVGLLLFWAVWFGCAFFSNLFDLINFYLDVNFIVFHSGNIMALDKVISIYHTPSYILQILFYGDLFAEILILYLFLKSTYCFYQQKNNYWKYVNLAFLFSIALWCIFIIMEEIFIAYSFESTHIRLCIFEMLTLLVIHLIPSEIKL